MPRLVLLSLCLFVPAPARAEALPLVEDVDWPIFRAHCLALLDDMRKIKSPLPPAEDKAVRALLEPKKPDNPALAAVAVQKRLDEHCLFGVTINPESRVKTARGPRKAELALCRAVHVLVKVQNDGGVTHRLAADSPQKVGEGKEGKEGDGWLELGVLNELPFRKGLSGRKVEYRVLKLTARQAGKREATIAFDVGQGSQELGFRAEVPVLFVVRAK